MEKQDYQFVKEKTYLYELRSIKKIWVIIFLSYAFYHLIRYLFLTIFQKKLPLDYYLFFQELSAIPLIILGIFSLYYVIMKLFSLKSLFYPDAHFLTKQMINRITIFLVIIALIPVIVDLLFGLIILSIPTYNNQNFYNSVLQAFPSVGLSMVLIFNYFILKEFFDSKIIKQFWQSALLLFLYPCIKISFLFLIPSTMVDTNNMVLLVYGYDPLEFILSIILFILALFMYKRKFQEQETRNG